MSSVERENLLRLALEITSEMCPDASFTRNLAAAGRSNQNVQSVSTAASGQSELAYLLRAAKYAAESYSPEVAMPILLRVSKHPQASEEQCIDALCQLAALHRRAGDCAESEYALGLATIRANRLEVVHHQARVLSELGITLLHQRDYLQSILVLKRSLNLAREAGSTLIELKVLGNLGNVSRYVRKHDDARSYYREVAERAIKTGNDKLAAIAQANLMLDEESIEALEQADSILKSLRDAGNMEAIASYLAVLGRQKTREKNFKKAGELLLEALNIALEAGHNRVLQTVLKYLSHLFQKTGESDIASELENEMKILRYTEAGSEALAQVRVNLKSIVVKLSSSRD